MATVDYKSATHGASSEIVHEKSFSERLKSLLAVDCIRASRIIETAQYAALYACICMPVGIFIDVLCSRLYPIKKEGKPYKVWHAIGVAILQVVLSAVSIIYIRKFADLVPFLFNARCNEYVPHYHVEEIFGEAAIALVFVGVQTTLIKTLEKIRDHFAGES